MGSCTTRHACKLQENDRCRYLPTYQIAHRCSFCDGTLLLPLSRLPRCYESRKLSVVKNDRSCRQVTGLLFHALLPGGWAVATTTTTHHYQTTSRNQDVPQERAGTAVHRSMVRWYLVPVAFLSSSDYPGLGESLRGGQSFLFANSNLEVDHLARAGADAQQPLQARDRSSAAGETDKIGHTLWARIPSSLISPRDDSALSNRGAMTIVGAEARDRNLSVGALPRPGARRKFDGQ